MRRKSIRRYLKYAGYGAAVGVVAITLACASGDSPGSRGRDARVAEQVEDHLSRARAEMKAGNSDRAMAAVDKAYELDRDNREVIRLRQEILASRGDEAPATDSTSLAQADRLLKSERYEEAANAYREILSTDPRNKDAQEGLKRAQKELAEVREDQVRDIVKQADRALDRDNVKEAQTLLAQAKELDPTSSRVRDLERDIQRAIEEEQRKSAKEAAETRKRAEEAAAAAKREEQKKVEREQAAAKRAAEEKKAAEVKKAKREAAEAEAAKKAAAEEEARKVAEAKKAKEAEAAREKAEEARKAKEAEAARKAAAEKEAAAEEEARKVAEAKKAEAREAAKKAEEARKAKEAEAARKAAAEKEAAAEEEARKVAEAKKAEEAEAREAAKKAEEARKAKEAEAAREVVEEEKEEKKEVAKATDSDKARAEAREAEKKAEADRKAAEKQAERDRKAAEKKARAEEEKARAEAKEKAAADKARKEQAEDVFKQGLEIYEDKPVTLARLESARAKWEEALELDSDLEEAQVYLEDTQAEFERMTEERDAAANFEARERAAEQKLDTLIRINTIQPTALPEFLRTIKLLSGIDFVLTGGVETRIEADFTDKPLREVLDSILLPIGLKWERKPGEDVVVITPDLRTQVFPVTPEQLNTVDSLIERGTLQELMYGQAEAVMQGQEIYTDSRQSVVVMTDSVRNLEKMRNLLQELRNQDPVGLVYQSFTIQEEKAQQIKALLDAVLRVDDEAPYNPERKLIIEAGELIIKDTPENIRRVEELLQDRDFLKSIYSGELAIATFNLTPILEIQDNPDLARQFGETVRQQVETLLYAQEGRSKANAEGRRLWYDEATLQLTITDFPERIKSVQQFIESLPQIERKRRTKIVPLFWATASELADQIDTFLGGGSDDDDGGEQGDEVLKTLRTEGEFEFRGAFFRVTAVNENDVDDENDDEVELIARSGDESDEVTIEEFRLENVLGGEFTIVAEDVRPGSTPGEGRAKLRFIYNGPDGGGGGGGLTGDDGGGGGGEDDGAEDGEGAEAEEPLLDITVEPIDNLNSLFISYTSATDLQEVEFWIETLDVPTLQVSMEVKFVEVIENKARELKSSLATGDLTQGVSLSDSVIRSRFAQDLDEFRNPFEPGIEGLGSANLLKGSTVFDWVINSGETPISLQIQALEAQGIINVVNAPSVTVLNNETANFTITRAFWTPFVGSSTGTDDGGDDGGGGDGGDGGTGGGTTGSFNQTLLQTGSEIDLVDNLEVTPTVTQAGNITLSPIEVVIRDFDNNLAGLDFFIDPATLTNAGGSSTPTAVFNNFGFGLLEKDIETSARIRDGGTVVLGGWKNERSEMLDSGVPILRDIPFVGKFLFNRMQQTNDRITLLIFMTGSVVRD